MKKFRLSVHEREHKLLQEWLVERRNDACLTQRDLAKKIGVVHSLIGKVEKGERRLDVIEFVAYCEGLGANPCDFIKLLKKETTSRRK